MRKNKHKYPKGHWLGVGLMIGMPIGILIGIAMGVGMDNMGLGISLGPAMGAGIGLAIGAGLEAKNKDNVRETTQEEQSRQKRLMIITFLGLVILVLVSIMLFLKKRAEMGL